MLKWIKKKERYATGENGYLGRFICFHYYWNAGSPSKNDKGETFPWVLCCFLPGFKSVLGDYLNEKEAKEKAERSLRNWLKIAGLTKKED